MIPALLVVTQEPERARESKQGPGPDASGPGLEPQGAPDTGRPMTFLDHLEELRAAVWRSATVALILVATLPIGG